MHGHLDLISGFPFPFENYLGQLKKLVRSPQFCVAQVVRRLSEHDIFNSRQNIDSSSDNHSLKKEHRESPVPPGLGAIDSQFKEIFLHRFCIKMSTGDNCMKLGNNVVIVHNIVLVDGVSYFVYEEFVNQELFFDYHISFGDIYIWYLVYQEI